jgi:hypothetical protein
MYIGRAPIAFLGRALIYAKSNIVVDRTKELGSVDSSVV